MYETLPDVAVDDRVPGLFMIGFSILLLAMMVALAGIAIARARARRAGIYRKYVAAEDIPEHRARSTSSRRNVL